jgi:hypothetical protein
MDAPVIQDAGLGHAQHIGGRETHARPALAVNPAGGETVMLDTRCGQRSGGQCGLCRARHDRDASISMSMVLPIVSFVLLHAVHQRVSQPTDTH